MERRGIPRKGPPERKQISIRLPKEMLDFLDQEALRLTARPPFMDVTVSDVVRLSVMHYQETMASKPYQPRLCDIVSQGDESMCARCGKRWETAAGQPECEHAGSDDL